MSKMNTHPELEFEIRGRVDCPTRGACKKLPLDSFGASWEQKLAEKTSNRLPSHESQG
jgi:hypothetical protein